jgi:hypothetical protein
VTLGDVDSELVDRGFDGLAPATRYRIINRGYKHVANKYPWLWELAVASITVNPGEFSKSVAAASTDIPRFRNVDHVYMTTANQRKKLKPVPDQDFFEKWLMLDLTLATNRQEPTWYYIYNSLLYILAPPVSARTFDVHYHQRVVDLVNPTDPFITPANLDEAIVSAVLVRIHRRVHEVSLAQLAEGDLQEAFDEMRVDDDFEMSEEQDRVIPDTQWR